MIETWQHRGMQSVPYIWMNGEMVGWEDANVHVLTHALHYGTSVFEGVRAYATDKGPAVFRLEEHMERLVSGCKAYQIPMEYTPAELSSAVTELIRVNELPSAYIRPIAFRGLGAIGLNPTNAAVVVAIAAWEWGAYLGEEALRNGISVGVSSWRRIDQQSLLPNSKGGGAYLNSILARLEAEAGGFDEALLLNDRGFLAEGSGENLFLIRRGVVYTPPSYSGVLPGITRHSVVTLLREAGIEVVETSLTRSDAYAAEEAFFTGTAAEVTPIRMIDNRPVGDGKPGPITKQAQTMYMEAVTGKNADHADWLTIV